MENCYVKGKIVSNSGYIGGIVGNGQVVVRNSYAYVDIIGNGEYIGGIVGNNEQTGIDIKNNLYIGNIVNKKETELTKPIIGNSDKTNVNNYIYENNKINGKLYNKEKTLTAKQLRNKDTYIKMLKFDDNFNYENIENGILPKLNNAELTNLLPNQEDIQIPSNDIFIEEVKTLRTDNNNVQIQLIINNPNEYEINDVQIENMEHTILENRTVNQKTYLKLKATPIKYYDFYIINKITYAIGEENITLEVYDIINEAFYKEITKYEDWQNINKESYENYRLLTDLDFTGKQDVNNSLRINRLITEGKMHTLKNVTLEAKDKKISLIEESKNLIENINFENITIKSPYNYSGVISNNMGDIQNVNFNNINIEAEENSYIGCIGVNKGKIQNINLNNIQTIGTEKIGGFIGETDDTVINNIIGKNIVVKGKNRVGGIIGLISAYRSATPNMGTITNLKIENSEITGDGMFAGSIYGTQDGNSIIKENLSSISCKVVGVDYVGGIAGYSSWQGQGVKNVNVVNSQIIGEGENIGGIYGAGGYLINSYIRNSEIIANSVNSQNIGGIIGRLDWNIYDNGILHSTVTTNGENVGGIIGVETNNIERIYSLDSTVIGKNNVGAITGSSNRGNMQYVYTNSDVTGSGKAVGGFIGYLDNSKMTNLSNVTYINNSYYAGGTITGKENVGGVVGEIAKQIYDEDGKQRYYSNYIEANIVSEDKEKISLGIGNMKEENPKFINNHYYKYSKINGEYPNDKIEPYIPQENYLVEEELKNKETYTNKIKWVNNGYYDYKILNENKYPLLTVNNQILEYQEGISIPTDPTNSINEELEYEFTYQDKKIKTYKTHSEIYDKEGNSVKRKSKIYVKDGKLYLLDSNMPIVPKNFIFDTYNEKEYETVLGTDGKMYDLKESLTYPENFKNEGIKEIGNNLDTDKKEIEVLYKNGDKIKFNYQTGEVIYREKLEENKTNLLDYIGDKLKPKEETIFQNEKDYEETKELMNKLEEMPVEEAKNETIEDSENDNAEGNSSNYVTAYNKEKHKYEIYSEDELLNTSKQTVLTENEKIETNNLANFYSAQISKNVSKKGKTVIYVIICVVIIILVILLKKKRE